MKRRREFGFDGPSNEGRGIRIAGFDGFIRAASNKAEATGRKDSFSVKIMRNPEAIAANYCAYMVTGALDMTDQFQASIEKAVAAKDTLDETLKGFRSAIKNDLVSIGAAGDKVRDETRKIGLAVKAVLDMMTGTEMIRAIENTERLAAAMRTINELESTRVAFALISQESGLMPFEKLPREEQDGWRKAIKDAHQEEESA